MFVICGKSATGKDAIAKELKKLGYFKITTFTNRPMREGEVQDSTYHFISTEEFLTKYLDDFFIESNYFLTEEGVWYYGSSTQSILDADDKTFCILTPSGMQKLREKHIPYIGFLIEVSDETIQKRLELRGDKPSEAERRFKADKKDFENVDGLITFKVINENVSPEDAAKHIDIVYKEVRRK